MGAPWLLSFVGMAQVLGWQSRLPIVSPCDRGRVMNLWASDCGGSIPSEYAMDFAKVRSLSPSEFVRILAEDLGVQGVVAGENYRFGYKAAGSADDLVRLCADFGLASAIVGALLPELAELERRVETRQPGVIDASARVLGQWQPVGRRSPPRAASQAGGELANGRGETGPVGEEPARDAPDGQPAQPTAPRRHLRLHGLPAQRESSARFGRPGRCRQGLGLWPSQHGGCELGGGEGGVCLWGCGG
eukprot:TRINITY_DN3006_c0_g1_i1.p1 TRINITY_DN3006_c0_g1~~TRINITY_DN3006_c0_g1_i1.p1  ORF type:complete len:246 (-),score=17.25 TRINITY_DN3006_c0_g1_i1:240-977(-)